VTYSQDLSILALCGGWPHHGNFETPLNTNASFVLVTSDYDINTPTEWVATQFQQTPSSTVIRRHGDDHGSFFVPGPARDAEIAFLANGTIPSPTNQTLVTIFGPGSQIDPPADPYAVPVGDVAGDCGATCPFPNSTVSDNKSSGGQQVVSQVRYASYLLVPVFFVTYPLLF